MDRPAGCENGAAVNVLASVRDMGNSSVAVAVHEVLRLVEAPHGLSVTTATARTLTWLAKASRSRGAARLENHDRGTEPVTSLTRGRKDSDTTATLMCAVEQRRRYPRVCPGGGFVDLRVNGGIAGESVDSQDSRLRALW